MKHALFILIFLRAISIQAQSYSRLIELTGTISDKYPIKMVLKIKNDKVLGYYYYEKHRTKILVTGAIAGSLITLNESPDIDSEFKMGIIAELNDKTLVGEWVDKSKNKTLIFNAKIDSDQQTLTLAENIKQLEGNYKNINNSSKYDASIQLRNIKDDVFLFEISSGQEDGCVGYLKGLIEMENLSSGIYSDASCKELKMEATSGMITISEKKCDWHGANCSFEGTYRKNKKPTLN